MVSFNDFRSEYAALEEKIDKSIQRVLKSGWFVLGKEVEAFETEFSNYIGARFGIGVNSGSDALYLAIKALGIGCGDEVITVSHTMISTVDAISRNYAKPVFTDIDSENYTMDTSKIECKISNKTRAIIPVHLYGHPVNMQPLKEIARKYDLRIIEDACQAHGSEFRGVKVGGLGDIGCFSFYPTKNLGGYGDGGMLVTNDIEIAEKLRKLRNYGQTDRYYYEMAGINSRLDELQAAILRAKLPHLDQWNDRRRKVAVLYNELLGDKVVKPKESKFAKHVYHLYVIRHKKRIELQKFLLTKGIQSYIHYPLPVHAQKIYDVDVELPVTERICNEILSLPINPWISDNQVEEVCESIHSFSG